MKKKQGISQIQKDVAFLKESRIFIKQHFNGYSNINWHIYYSAFNGIKNKQYIPEDYFFNYIEPTLNNFNLYKAYADKNSYYNFINKQSLPNVICKIVNGDYFDENNLQIPEKDIFDRLQSYSKHMVLKPAIISGQGRNVIIASPTEITAQLKTGKFSNFSFIIQEKIIQHKKLSAFHPASVNTYRITTARVTGKIVVLSAYLRIGRNNKTIDNGMAGGIMCGINHNGTITEFAFDFNLNKMNKHPDTNIPFEGFTCPAFAEACSFCKDSHKKLIHFTLISWDISINENGKPICIEMNLKNQSISGHQLIHGPLFGQFTEELLEQFKLKRGKNLLYY